jgi:hypothetical protein
VSNGRRWVPIAMAAAVLTVPAVFEARGGDPSPAYRAELQRTLELRRQRRRTEVRPPAGILQTYPMPPALVIRHTRETHDEIGALLQLLRHGGR